LEIIRHDWWATPVWQFRIDSIDPKEIEQDCYAYEHTRNDRLLLAQQNINPTSDLNSSNVMLNLDWRTNTKFPAITRMLKEVEKQAPGLYAEFGVRDSFKQIIENYWVNFNKPGMFNKPHLHPSSVFTGVYYAKAEKNSGNIVIHNSSDKEFTLQSYTDKPTRFNMSNPAYEPSTGLVIIFPSWLQHSVEMNLSGTDRISVSFHFN
jgi:uncharacterized protein (TIGR02466 family)